jgi:hypothetical protein
MSREGIVALISEELRKHGLEGPYARVELVPIPGASTRYAAILDWDSEWWGCACVFEAADGRISRVQVLEHTEQSIWRVRCIAVESIEDPLLEIYGKTHMGHGNYYLYRLRPERAQLIIRTTAVDYHRDDDVLWGGELRPEYRDANGDGLTDVILSGMRYYNLEEDWMPGWKHQEEIAKCFLYHPQRGTFVEDESRRVGTHYHD